MYQIFSKVISDLFQSLFSFNFSAQCFTVIDTFHCENKKKNYDPHSTLPPGVYFLPFLCILFFAFNRAFVCVLEKRVRGEVWMPYRVNASLVVLAAGIVGAHCRYIYDQTHDVMCRQFSDTWANQNHELAWNSNGSKILILQRIWTKILECIYFPLKFVQIWNVNCNFIHALVIYLLVSCEKWLPPFNTD